MLISTAKFGYMPSARQVDMISVKHENAGQISLISYGAKLASLLVPDKNGKLRDVVLGYNKLEDYINGNRFFGSNPGPFANRIGNARFVIDGIEYKFQPNANGHLLHSGTSALESVVWDYEIGNDFVKFIYKSPDGEFGFPGNKTFEIIYQWTEDLVLSFEYKVITDKATHVNLTHHSYFNLDGEDNGSILDHQVSINAPRFLEVDDDSIPTGEFLHVHGTPLDLRKQVKIADRIFSEYSVLQKTMGFDQCFVIDRKEGEPAHCASLRAASSGISMDVYSTLPGLQFYTGNHDNGMVKGKSGKIYPVHGSLCLEPQHFPNAPNIPSFPSTLLRPGEQYHEFIQFHFNKINPA